MTKQIDLKKYEEFVDAVTSEQSKNNDAFIAERLTAGSAFEAHWETADADGSDNLVHNIWGVGKHDGYTNRERLVHGTKN